MEFALNLVWLVLSALIVGMTVWAVRKRTLTRSAPVALTAAVALCFILLPIISISDDLLQARERGLPLAAQTWHLAKEDASAGLDLTPMLQAWMRALLALLAEAVAVVVCAQPVRRKRTHCAWLTRAQRLRPPPEFAL